MIFFPQILATIHGGHFNVDIIEVYINCIESTESIGNQWLACSHNQVEAHIVVSRRS